MRHTRYMSADPNDRNSIPAVPAIPDELMQSQSAYPYDEPAQDNLGPLLPSTTFGQLPATTFGQPIAPARSASAPPEDISPVNVAPRISPTYPPGRRGSAGSRGHARMSNAPNTSATPNYKRVSPPPVTASIDETIHESQVIILEQDPAAPPLLAELQHLAGPPPPPPPPLYTQSRKNSLGVINIAIDEKPNDKPQDAASPTSGPAGTGSPITHRRGRGSMSDNLGMTFKRVAERMRSTSRSRNKSPPLRQDMSPYESIPEFSFPRSATARSPTEGNELPFSRLSPPPPPPLHPMEQAISPIDVSNPQYVVYRHPKEVRANMPPETLQAGVYQQQQQQIETPMI